MPWIPGCAPSMISPVMGNPRQKIGELLLTSGAIDRQQLNAALGYQKRWGGKLGEIVVDMQFAGDDRICGALARQLGVPAVDLESREIPDEVVRAVPRACCEKYKLFPFELVHQAVGQPQLWIAMADPTNIEAIDEVRFRSGMRVSVAAAPASMVDAAIRRYIYGERQDGSGGRTYSEPISTALIPEAGTTAPRADGLVDLELLLADRASGELDAIDAIEWTVEEVAPPRRELNGVEKFGSAREEDRLATGVDPTKVAALHREILARIEALANGREGMPPIPAWKILAALVDHLVRQGVVEDGSFLDDLERQGR